MENFGLIKNYSQTLNIALGLSVLLYVVIHLEFNKFHGVSSLFFGFCLLFITLIIELTSFGQRIKSVKSIQIAFFTANLLLIIGVTVFYFATKYRVHQFDAVMFVALLFMFPALLFLILSTIAIFVKSVNKSDLKQNH